MTDSVTVPPSQPVQPRAARLLLWVCLPALLLFMLLAWQIVDEGSLAFDPSLLSALRVGADPAVPHGPAWLLKAARDVTALGGGPVLTLVTLLAVGYLLARGRKGSALILAMAVSSGAWLNDALKHAIARERPDIVPHLVEVSSASFPSAHAMNSAVLFLTMAMLLRLDERRASARSYLLGAALLLCFLIGATRIYLGVHWPSDVLAGWSLGTAWAGAWAAAAVAWDRLRGEAL